MAKQPSVQPLEGGATAAAETQLPSPVSNGGPAKSNLQARDVMVLVQKTDNEKRGNMKRDEHALIFQ
uniref:Uncharacterized protein n=1 Tax=Sphaerodactylus townsendi TaxID=933632 RepID=A0ACB8FZV0_9SAUR